MDLVEGEIKSVAFYFSSFRLATLLAKLVYPVECVSRYKSTFILLVMNLHKLEKL